MEELYQHNDRLVQEKSFVEIRESELIEENRVCPYSSSLCVSFILLYIFLHFILYLYSSCWWWYCLCSNKYGLSSSSSLIYWTQIEMWRENPRPKQGSGDSASHSGGWIVFYVRIDRSGVFFFLQLPLIYLHFHALFIGERQESLPSAQANASH